MYYNRVETEGREGDSVVDVASIISKLSFDASIIVRGVDDSN
jgi:hypothetical protein